MLLFESDNLAPPKMCVISHISCAAADLVRLPASFEMLKIWAQNCHSAKHTPCHRGRKASRSRSRKMLIVRFALKQVIKRLALPKSLMLNSFAGGFRLPPETDCSNGSGTNSYLVCFGGRVGEFYYRFTWSSFKLFKNSGIFLKFVEIILHSFKLFDSEIPITAQKVGTSQLNWKKLFLHVWAWLPARAYNSCTQSRGPSDRMSTGTRIFK